MKITAAAGSRKDSFRRTLSDRLYCNGACSVATTSDQGDLLQYQGKETQEALFALFGNTDKESNSENAGRILEARTGKMKPFPRIPLLRLVSVPCGMGE